MDIVQQVTKNTDITFKFERQRLADPLNIAKGTTINFEDPLKYCLEYLQTTLNNQGLPGYH